MYTGDTNHLNWKNVTDLYKLGDKYTVEDLKRSCVEQIKRNISTGNFSVFFLLSQQFNDLDLTKITIKFFLKNSLGIINNDNWLTFSSKNLVESNVLIKALAVEVNKKYIRKLP